MGTLIGTLQGSYAYLLIFQVIVVTVLLLALLWLIARRLRQSAVETEVPNTVVVQQVPAPVDSSANEELVALSREQTEKIRALESQVVELERSGSGLGELKDRNKSLTDKVSFLEQKLLEYEILQEEIGALTTLKLENEKLREQIQENGMTPIRSSDLSVPLGTQQVEPTLPSSALNLKPGELEGIMDQIDDLTDAKKKDPGSVP